MTITSTDLVCILLLLAFRVQAKPPKPEILSTELLPNGVLVKWNSGSVTSLTGHEVTYTGSDNSVTKLAVSGSELEAVLQFVRPCINYSVVIQSFEGKIGSDLSEPASFMGRVLPKPDRPIGLQVDQNNRILRWNHPNNTAYIRKYSIYGRNNLGDQHQMEVVYYQNSAELSDLQPQKEYEVWMTAENLCGVSEATETVRVLTFEVPAAPQITSVQSFTDSIVIHFRPGEGGGPVDSFLVRYSTKNNGKQTVELPADGTQVNLTVGIESCFGHEIEVMAINRAGESAPGRTTAFTKSADAPEVPTITKMEELSDGYLLSWAVNRTEDIVEYQVIYERLLGGSVEVLSIPSNTLETTITKLEQCRNYTVRVRALGNCGISNFSEAKLLHAKPQSLPLKPANLSASGNNHQCTISWSKGADLELRTRYELAYAKSEGYSRFYWLPPDSVQFTLKNLDVRSVYLVDLWSHNECGWSEAANLKLFFDVNGTLIVE